MASEKREAFNSAAPPSPTEKPRRRRRLSDDLLPESYGLFLAGVLAVALIAVVLLADFILQRQAAASVRDHADAAARTVAVMLAEAPEPDANAEDAWFERLSKRDSIVSARYLTGEGRVLKTWPVQPSIAASASQPAAGVHASALVFGRAEIVGPDGKARGMIEIGLLPPAGQEHRPLLLKGCAVAVAFMVAAHLVTYRRLRKHLRPMAAVQRSLQAYSSGLEKQITALSLSDTLGQIAQAWNHLVDHVAQLQEQMPRDGHAGGGNALQRFESRALRQILDHLPVGVLRFGRSQMVSYVNSSAGRLLGRSAEELNGKLLCEVVDEEGTAPLLEMQTHASVSTPIDRKRGEGDNQVTLRFLVIPTPEVGDGEAVVTIEDVSHLQEAERARDNFLYHVTHELRTPLTNIQAYAETLTKPAFDDEQTRRECYNVIVSETRRLSRLVEDILSISQLEVGTARIELGEVDLARLLRQMVQDNLGHADEKRIDLTLRMPPKVPKIRGDKQRLSVLINNLIGNAIKYTPRDGQVSVVLEVTDRSVSIAVIDTGIGIGPEDQPHVFEKFYRAAGEEVQAVSGTGLGLAIAREVARLHGGDIRLQSEKEKGSTFTIELPRGEGDSASGEKA